MVAYVKSVCAVVNAGVNYLDQLDRCGDEESGQRTTRNYIPIGTGTLFKIQPWSAALLFLFGIPYVIKDCFRDEAQNELTCRIFTDGLKIAQFICVAGANFLSYRIVRNFLSDLPFTQTT